MAATDDKSERTGGDDRLEIFRGAVRGLSSPSLAQMYGLSIAEVEQILNEHLAEHQASLERSPEGRFAMHALQSEALLEELAAAASRESNGAVRAALLSTKLRVLKHRLALDQAAGLLPEDPQNLRIYFDALRLAKGVRKLIPDDRLDELRELLPERTAESPRLPSPREGSV